MTEAVDENLDLEALKKGDAREFARLVDRYQSVVLGLCQSLGLQGADRDDAAAEVFAAVFRSIKNFEGRSALGTWVYRIATRVIPKVRHRYRDARAQQPDEGLADPKQPSPMEASSQAETNEQVWAAVAKLEERSAMIVELHYRRGLSVEEIGNVMQCPPGTVKTLLFRARARLKELLGRREMAP